MCIQIEGGIGEYIDITFDASNTTACGATADENIIYCPSQIDEGAKLLVTNCWCSTLMPSFWGFFCHDWFCKDYHIGGVSFVWNSFCKNNF